MIGQLIKYLLLGILAGMGDRFLSEWFRHGRERRKQRELLASLRYLLANYQPNSFETDAQKPEYRKALMRARAHYRDGDCQAARRMEELFARAEGTPLPPAGAPSRTLEWLKREKIQPLDLRGKASVSVVICLLIDVWTLVSGGWGAGMGALLWTLLEAPALLVGLLGAPWISRSIGAGMSTLGAGGDLSGEIRSVASEIERNKRSLDLRLRSTAALPGEAPSALPPTG